MQNAADDESCLRPRRFDDLSPAMVALTQLRLEHGVVSVGSALELPFANGTFERVLTAHFYGHLPLGERESFLAEARRVGRELVVVDAALRPGIAGEQWQRRVLNDGSRHRVFKRFLEPHQLADEIGGDVLLDGTWFVAARVRWNQQRLPQPPRPEVED
jgi:hypothetical protein